MRLISGLEHSFGDFAGLGLQNYPRIAASGNAAAIAWKQTVNGISQLAVQFTDNVANGFPPGYTVLVASNVENADVALANGKIFVVWEATNDGTVKYKTGTYATTSLLPEETLEHTLRVSPNPVGGNELSLRLEGAEGKRVTIGAKQLARPVIG